MTPCPCGCGLDIDTLPDMGGVRDQRPIYEREVGELPTIVVYRRACSACGHFLTNAEIESLNQAPSALVNEWFCPRCGTGPKAVV